MSLHALASHMAAKGRGGDSVLVHMSPDEVRALQALAERHGKTLTINPETGQPEAFSLKSLLPALAGAALTVASGGALSPLMAAGIVGGTTALATGDISRGLMAGLGAYGGAGLGDALVGAGSGAAQSAAMSGLTQDEIARRVAEENLANMATSTTSQGVVNQAAADAATNFAKSSTASQMGAGLEAITKSPEAFGQFAKDNWKTLAAATVPPMLAGEGVKTTTPRPMDTGYIRQKKFNPYTQQYIDLEPVKASEWGSRRFSDYAGGGIVALADGGYSQDYVDQLVREAATQAGGTLSYADAMNAASNLGISADQLQNSIASGAITGAPGGGGDVGGGGSGGGGPAPGSAAYNQMVGNWFQQYPNVTSADIENAINTYGLKPQDVYNAMQASGLSAAARYSAFHPDVGVPDTPQGGLAGLTSNINQWVSNALADPYITAAEKRSLAQEAMDKWGYSMDDIVRATGKTVAELFPDVKPKTQTVLPTNPTTNAPPGTTNPYGNVNTPGDITRNPDGTVTVQPNIPGRPYGGFSGMGEVKSAYTAGGGSLGPTNLFVPKTIEEMYNRYTTSGGSQQAYDYLMNRGAASIKKPVAPGGQLMLPYAQSVLGQEIPAITSGPSTQKYIFDWKNRRYIPNPNYVDPNAKTEKPAANGGVMRMALGGLGALAAGGQAGYNLGSYSDGGRLLRGPGDGVSDSIPATIGNKQPARLADGEFVVPARIVSELGNGSTDAGARKLYAMMDRVQRARGKTTGKGKVAKDTSADKYLPA